MNNIIMITLAIVAITAAYYLFFYKIETMTNILPEQQAIVNLIYDYIITNPDGTFADYINFLISIKNTNLYIIDNEVFVTFKMLQKRKLFSKDDIISAMKLT